MASDTEAPALSGKRRVGKIGLGLIVDRIELARLPDDGTEPTLDWSVSASVVKGSDNTHVMIVGHLFRLFDGGLGQVRSVAALSVPEWDADDPDALDKFINDYGYGFVEPLYDTCRRALLIQSVQMELDLDLPSYSPVCLIENGDNESAEEDDATEADLDSH